MQAFNPNTINFTDQEGYPSFYQCLKWQPDEFAIRIGVRESVVQGTNISLNTLIKKMIMTFYFSITLARYLLIKKVTNLCKVVKLIFRNLVSIRG